MPARTAISTFVCTVSQKAITIPTILGERNFNYLQLNRPFKNFIHFRNRLCNSTEQYQEQKYPHVSLQTLLREILSL